MSVLARVARRVRSADRRSLALTLVPVVPVVVAIVRMLLEHRAPLGDNGLIALRSHDVLTSNHPWYGTWTSASLSAGVDFNNPSPLQFDLLAIFVKPFGVAAGAVMGAGCINIAAMVLAVRQGWRAAGRRGEVLFSLCAAGLAWSLGSEMLVDVWQPHNLVLPFLAFLACCTAVAAGRWTSLGWAVGVGSVVVGTHLSFVYVTMVVFATSVVWALVWSRGQVGARAGALRAALVAGLVALVCWAQSLIEQLFLDGRGNLSRLVEASGASSDAIGLRLGARLVAQVVVMPPWWLRPSFTGSIPATAYSPDGGLRPAGVVRAAVAGVSLLAVLVLLAVLSVRCHRRADRPAGAVLAVAGSGLVGVLLTTAVMPAGVIGLAPHQMRWIWPVAALVTAAVTMQVVDAVVPGVVRDAVRRAGGWRVVALVGVVALSVVNLPAHESDLGPFASRAANGAIRSLMAQVARTGLPGPTAFDDSTLAFAEPYSGAVLAALVEAGAPIRAGTASFTRQMGDQRRPRGDERWTMQVREGDGADRLAPGESLLASAITPQGWSVAVVLIEQPAN